eukprot:3182064-Alexandrium_andersonii.AAC.1
MLVKLPRLHVSTTNKRSAWAARRHTCQSHPRSANRTCVSKTYNEMQTLHTHVHIQFHAVAHNHARWGVR